MVPIKNTAHKRRNKECLRLCCSNGLQGVKNKREIATNAFCFKYLGGLYALPSCCNFNEYTRSVSPEKTININQVAGSFYSGTGVKRFTCIYFGGNEAGYQLQKFCAHDSGESVAQNIGVHVFRLISAGKLQGSGEQFASIFIIGHR